MENSDDQPARKIKKPRRIEAWEFGAGNETRTRDPNLGKVVLYQLSYSRYVKIGKSSVKKYVVKLFNPF
jgi:hypothetical protein